MTIAREAILAKHHPDGFNIGVNIGETAGQTVPHLHVHLIPRYSQDVQDPRGGVRHVIPSRANYLKPESSSAEKPADRVADAGPRSLQAPSSTKADSLLVTDKHDLPNRAPINIFVVFRARNSKSLTLRVKVEKSTKLSVRWNISFPVDASRNDRRSPGREYRRSPCTQWLDRVLRTGLGGIGR